MSEAGASKQRRLGYGSDSAPVGSSSTKDAGRGRPGRGFSASAVPLALALAVPGQAAGGALCPNPGVSWLRCQCVAPFPAGRPSRPSPCLPRPRNPCRRHHTHPCRQHPAAEAHQGHQWRWRHGAGQAGVSGAVFQRQGQVGAAALAALAAAALLLLRQGAGGGMAESSCSVSLPGREPWPLRRSMCCTATQCCQLAGRQARQRPWCARAGSGWP